MALNFEVNISENTTLPISTASSIDGWILLGNNSLRHNSTKTTRVSKTFFNTFVLNTNYKVTFTVDNYQSCWVKLIVNDVETSLITSNGDKELFFVANDVSQTLIFESNGYLDIINVQITEITPNLKLVDYTDSDYFENKSFTVSYDLINNKWISYHEDLPNNYFRHNTDYLTFTQGNNIKKSGSANSYLKAILEIVNNEYPTSTKVLDSITTNVETYTVDEEKVNDFFNKLIVYDEFQTTGELELDSTNLTKKEKNWNINKFLDMAKEQSNVKLFTDDWEYIKNNYFIDKVPNPDGIDTTKPWFKRGRFRDKYFIIRFFYDNLDSRKIIINFVNTQYRISQR